MSESSPQIVITGIGVVSPLGIGCDAFLQAFETGESVIKWAHGVGDEYLPYRYFSEVADFDPKAHVQPRKSIKLMCREVQMGVSAGQLAVDHARLAVDQINSDRFGVVLGSEMLYGSADEMESVYRQAVERGECDLRKFGESIGELFPLWMLRYLPNMPACHLAIAQSAFGPNNSIVQGNASGLLAIAEAVTMIQRGWVDVVIAGGVGSQIRATRSVNLNPDMFAHSGRSPEFACRPFDIDRDGMVPSEGSAAFVLESRDHALARGAEPLAGIAGFGRVFQSAYDMHAPCHNGASILATRRAIRNAMFAAGCEPSQIDHVNANGLATIESDRREAVAIREELGDVDVTAIKGFYGNAGAAGSVIDMAVSVLAMHGEMPVPPVLNCDHLDAECPIRAIRGVGRELRKPAAIVLSQSSTGQSAAIVLRR